MRKVNIEAEVTVLVPVKVLVDILVRADDDAKLDYALERWAKGKVYTKADVENVQLEEIIQIGEEMLRPEDNMENASFRLRLAAVSILEAPQSFPPRTSNVVVNEAMVTDVR